MDKMFTVAGVSTLNGVVKYRVANSLKRDAVLKKSGHTDIKLIELPNPMTKEDAVAYLLSIDFANGNKEVQAALDAAADKRGVNKPAKAPKATKVTAKKAVAKTKTVNAKPLMTKTGAATVKTAVQSEATAVAKVEADLEDAPF